MKVYNENLGLIDFKSCSGATDIKNTIIENNNELYFNYLTDKLYYKMRERAIQRILNLTDKYSIEELKNIEETLDLVELSYTVEKLFCPIRNNDLKNLFTEDNYTK